MSSSEARNYLIDPRKNNGDSGETFIVEAKDIGEAAQKAAREILGELKPTEHAQRTTGDFDGSGMFQVYSHVHGTVDTWSTRGYPFHVMEW